uniref:Iron-sulfur cluster co-chaperone protein HscB, mitochondrial n=1 Tax=Cacopsylla melanoneura TaxID=428564 RepID=A0A8D8STA2_9HEMI
MWNSKTLLRNSFLYIASVFIVSNLCVTCAPFSETSASAASKLHSGPSGQTGAMKTGSANLSSSSCWACFKNPQISEQNPVFCAHCFAVQKHNPAYNHYEHFGIKPNYTIDSDALFSKHLQLQHKLLNPQYYLKRNVTDEELKIGDEHAKQVAKAYFTLDNPLERGLYYLALKHNMKLDENARTVQDEDLARDILILNEELRIMQTSIYMDRLEFDIEKSRDDVIENLEKAFRDKDMIRAKDLLVALKLLLDLKERFDKKWDDFPSSEEKDRMEV